jgi:hypothetical protein
VRVRFAPEARDAAREKRAWWEKHRDKAPQLFREELRAAVARLRTVPAEGRRYAIESGRIIWRVLMPKTGNHVYYRIDDTAGDVEVLTIWNAQSEEPPDFSV